MPNSRNSEKNEVTGTKKNKLGILIQHYDARNDIRHLVDKLAESEDVVIFANSNDIEKIHTKAEKRAFIQKNTTIHKLWLMLFLLFGKIPKSKNNFIINALFKQEGINALHRIKLNSILLIRSTFGGIISFDFLTRRLKKYDQTDISDIRKILAITDFSNITFIAKVLNSNTPVDAYVYSWDHACKHTTFSKKARTYLTWSPAIVDDLVELQGIDRSKCHAVGATQFIHLEQYHSTNKANLKTPDFHYFYYGCGIGNFEISKREILVIEQIAKTCSEHFPDMKLIVRPYPMLRKTDHFESLLKFSNIVFDDDYQTKTEDRSLTQEDILQRLHLQNNAKAFLHCGTTMGLECCHLNTPSLFINLDSINKQTSKPKRYSLPNFINQYHNVRYLQNDQYINVIHDEDDLRKVLLLATQGNAELLKYNNHIAKLFPIVKSDKIINALKR